MTAEAALERAEAMDREIADGICGAAAWHPRRAQGQRVHAPRAHHSGSRIFADNVPEADAEIVQRLDRAGAVTIGKTSMHELAYGITQ